ncbi:MAG: PHB depolymerase family esterase [Bacteroidota bacterium]
MMKSKLQLLLLFVLLSFLSQAQSTPIIIDTSPVDTITVDTVDRIYSVYVPNQYDGSESWPVVFNLHEANATLPEYITVVNTNAVADTANFLVVYPKALNGFIAALDTVSPIWQDGTLAGNPQADDVAFIDQLIDQLALDYNIDPARIYLAGLGSGGAAAAFLTCQLSDRIAAMANVQGFIDCMPPKGVPGLFMYGTADPIIPEGGIPGFLPPFVAGVKTWATASSCDTIAVETPLSDIDPADSSTVSVFSYPNCAQDSEVLYYRIEGGGRNWAGGIPIPTAGPINFDINADVEIWNFFKRYSLPQPQLLDLTLEHQDSIRKYALYVPVAYDGSEAWPLVINMHGLGSNRFAQIFTSQMNAVADTGNFIVVYPEATRTELPLGGIGPAWNTELVPNRVDDIDFISQLIQTLAQDYNLDLSRVYSTGLSQGGVMSYILACNIPDQIAAIASVAGVQTKNLDWMCTAERPMPVLHIHGTVDAVVPYNGGIGALGPSFVFPTAREQVGSWINGNACSNDSTVVNFPDLDTTDGSTVTLTKFENCDNYSGLDGETRTAEVWFYTIEGGGHTWPGGPPVPPGFEILGNVNGDINASSEIWNFFNRQELATAIQVVNPSLFQIAVYPNPFSDELNVEFELPQSAFVQMTLYSPLGQRVAQIANERMPEGKQRLQWSSNSSALPAGIYYYRLQIGNQLISEPIVIN